MPNDADPAGIRSCWTTVHDPLAAPVLADLAARYEQLYGPGAHAEMSAYPAAEFAPPGGGFLLLVAGGAAVAAGESVATTR